MLPTYLLPLSKWVEFLSNWEMIAVAAPTYKKDCHDWKCAGLYLGWIQSGTVDQYFIGSMHQICVSNQAYVFC